MGGIVAVVDVLRGETLLERWSPPRECHVDQPAGGHLRRTMRPGPAGLVDEGARPDDTLAEHEAIYATALPTKGEPER